ncbi:MAG: SGNH/GDSL hydrolase family protein [Candidatus Alcyoniella australis]|nr:SGNH/GDSL hydrolase family protein [Candidatus Alcyoniella australis]
MISKRAKDYLFSLLSIVAVLALVGLISEIVLRAQDPQGFKISLFGSKGNYVDDEVLGWRPVQEQYFWHESTRPLVLQKSENAIRVFAMGDSFTKAHGGIGRENSFYHLIEQRLEQRCQPGELEVFHFGVSGYCQRQQQALIERFGSEYSPDLVIIQAYLGNDVGENGELIIRRVDSEGKWHNSYQGQSEQPNQERVEPATKRLADFLYVHSYATRFYGRRLKIIWWKINGIPIEVKHPGRGHQPKPTALDSINVSPHILQLMNRDVPQPIELAWERTDSLIGQIQRTAQAMDCGLFFILVPQELQVNHDAWREAVESFHLDQALFDRELPNARFIRILEQHQIDYLDLTPIFRRLIENGSDLYDGHFNAEGHRATAEATLEALSASGMLP